MCRLPTGLLPPFFGLPIERICLANHCLDMETSVRDQEPTRTEESGAVVRQSNVVGLSQLKTMARILEMPTNK